MIDIKNGNLFKSNCKTLVNPVNCVGVMGAGIALEFKKRFPEMFEDYKKRCADGKVKIGEPYIFQENGINILNFPTKNHWKMLSKLSYITKGLDWFAEHYEEYGIDSIAFPALGCGCGGLEWGIIYPIMHQKLRNLPIQIEIYAPVRNS